MTVAFQPRPKADVWRCEAYRRLVASMDCAHCHRPGPSQAAHADQGKGMALKADDRTCYPACADGPMRQGCHSLIGSRGLFSRDQRRTIEQNHARKTREAIRQSGQWKESWPVFEEP